MKIEEWPIGDVKPYEKNPRINEAAVAAVAASIKDFGWVQPIVVDASGVIIAGHTRLKAAQSLGLAQVPVHVAKFLTPDQVKALRIADNKLHELSEWNEDLLRTELESLHKLIDMTVYGFGKDEIDEILAGNWQERAADPDDVPGAPDAATTVPGDIWVLGGHRLMCGDSSKPSDLDRLLDGQPIHLVNTDPPYNVKVEPRSNNAIVAGLSSFALPSKAYQHDQQSADLNRYPENSRATHKKLRAKDRPLANDCLSEEAFGKMRDAWFGNIARVLIPGGGFYIWGGYANCGNYPPALKRCELYFAQAIIWIKEHPVITRKDFMGNHEWCFYGWREGAAHRFFGPANCPDVWRIQRAGPEQARSLDAGVRVTCQGSTIDVLPSAKARKLAQLDVGDGAAILVGECSSDIWSVKKVNPAAMVHLTEKPVELARRAIEYSSQPGENVLDLFGGSGSTLIACEMTARHAFLMEMDALCCDVIVQRWEKFTGKKAERIRAADVPKPKPAAVTAKPARPS